MEHERPPICAECGYDLTGLRPAGRCPECGQEFDRSTGRGLQWDTPQHRVDRGLRRVRTVALAVMAVLVLTCAGGATTIARNPGRVVAMGAIVAMVLLAAAFTSYVYERDQND